PLRLDRNRPTVSVRMSLLPGARVAVFMGLIPLMCSLTERLLHAIDLSCYPISNGPEAATAFVSRLPCLNPLYAGTLRQLSRIATTVEISKTFMWRLYGNDFPSESESYR